ncbi:unnamed protein product [Urochloa humidicola]
MGCVRGSGRLSFSGFNRSWRWFCGFGSCGACNIWSCSSVMAGGSCGFLFLILLSSVVEKAGDGGFRC